MTMTPHPTHMFDFGRMLIELGTALLQGRLQLVDGSPLTSLGQLTNGTLGHEPTHVSNDSGALSGAYSVETPRFIPPVTGPGRPSARGAWTARKGYHAVAVKKGGKAPDIKGVTPAGTRLLEYVQRNPGQPAVQIADDLGLSRKTVENLLSILRQRHLIEPRELSHT